MSENELEDVESFRARAKEFIHANLQPAVGPSFGMRDVGMLTLYVMSNSWVARKGIAIFPRADELTIAISTRPQPSP